MDEAIELVDYLPVYFKTSEEQQYVSSLWETFEENYQHGKYQFALLAYHMLMMSFVYFNIWQIKKTRPDDFTKGLIGFNRNVESEILKGTSPFSLSVVNEKIVFRFLKLIGCDNDRMGRYSKLVEVRNDAAHANGHSYFVMQSQLDEQIRRVLSAVVEIQAQSHPVILHCYKEFLALSCNVDEREYQDEKDQIREILIHENYMSRKDLELCVNLDTAGLNYDNKDCVNVLHETLREMYESD
ncbi:MAG: hypothetical protein OXH02_06665 [Gemmatimonadetes bacterium]|nr:hypothetical protein [Gemmatimonadota bacterium]